MLKHVPRDVVAYATTSDGGSFFSGKSQVVLPIRFSARKGLHFFEHLSDCEKSHSLNFSQDAKLHEQGKNHPEIRFGFLRFQNFKNAFCSREFDSLDTPLFVKLICRISFIQCRKLPGSGCPHFDNFLCHP